MRPSGSSVQAWHWFWEQKEQLARVFEQQTRQADDIAVVLLGRPYLILDLVMNQQIPQKFNAPGIKTFFQDMLPLTAGDFTGPAREFVDWNHWKSESFFKALEKDIGLPIVSIAYDGTTARKNEVLAPYLHYILQTIADKPGV